MNNIHFSTFNSNLSPKLSTKLHAQNPQRKVPEKSLLILRSQFFSTSQHPLLLKLLIKYTEVILPLKISNFQYLITNEMSNY